MSVVVKVEIPSPERTRDNDDEDVKHETRKKLSAIDKWRTRVLFCQPKQCNESWRKKIERQMAVLRVAFPFLTERQIRGKAWKSCGFTSIMGGLPRYGLAPEVKKEFKKYRYYHKFNRLLKSKVEKRIIKMEECDKNFDCPYTFKSPKDQLGTPQSIVKNMDTIPSIPQSGIAFNNLNRNLSLMSGVCPLPKSSNESIKKISDKEKSRRKLSFNNQSGQALLEDSNIAVKDFSFNVNSPYFSLFKNAKPHLPISIISSLTKKSDSQSHNIQDSSSIQTDTSKTLSGLDCIVVNPFSRKSINNCSNENKKKDYASKKQEIIQSSTLAEINSNEVQTNDSLITHNTVQVNIDSSAQRNATFMNQTEKSLTDSDATISGLDNIYHISANNNQNFKINNNLCNRETLFINKKISDEEKNIVPVTPAKVYQNNSKVGSSVEGYLQHEQLYEANILKSKISRSYKDIYLSSPGCKNENISKQVEVTGIYNSPIKNNVFTDGTVFLTHECEDLSIIKHSSLTVKSFDSTHVYHNSSEAASLMDVESNTEYYETELSNNVDQCTEKNSKELYSQNLVLSLPLTQDNDFYTMLPSNVFLSNYCCEYNNVYMKKDLKPSLHKDYFRINKSLKEDFNKVIPTDQSLKSFFNTQDKNFSEVEAEVHEVVNYILLMLEDEQDKLSWKYK